LVSSVLISVAWSSVRLTARRPSIFAGPLASRFQAVLSLPYHEASDRAGVGDLDQLLDRGLRIGERIVIFEFYQTDSTLKAFQRAKSWGPLQEKTSVLQSMQSKRPALSCVKRSCNALHSKPQLGQMKITVVKFI